MAVEAAFRSGLMSSVPRVKSDAPLGGYNRGRASISLGKSPESEETSETSINLQQSGQDEEIVASQVTANAEQADRVGRGTIVDKGDHDSKSSACGSEEKCDATKKDAIKVDGDPEHRVQVERPQTWHDKWTAWQEYYEDYCSRTHQVLPVAESQGHAERNRRISISKKGKQGELEPFPEELDPYMRVYICTHGWKKRKSRAQGKRPRQHIRFTGCEFRFVVQWQKTEAGWKLRVMSGGRYVHNHDVSTDVYSTYPCSRGISDPMVEARVEGMLDAGAKRSKIYQYLLEHDQNVVMADVDNMVSTRKSAVSTLNDHEATAAEVARFNAIDPENVSTVAENESGTVGVISLSTSHMRTMFSRFPEVLLVDSSHKTNR